MGRHVATPTDDGAAEREMIAAMSPSDRIKVRDTLWARYGKRLERERGFEPWIVKAARHYFEIWFETAGDNARAWEAATEPFGDAHPALLPVAIAGAQQLLVGAGWDTGARIQGQLKSLLPA